MREKAHEMTSVSGLRNYHYHSLRQKTPETRLGQVRSSILDTLSCL